MTIGVLINFDNSMNNLLYPLSSFPNNFVVVSSLKNIKLIFRLNYHRQSGKNDFYPYYGSQKSIFSG